MALLRIRTEVEDRPGRLAVLTAALAARGANILDVSVQVDTEGIVDEFIVDCPSRNGAEELHAAVEAAGGLRNVVTPASPRDLIDEPTRALTLLARLRSDPSRLPETLAELLRADEAEWVPGPAALPLSPRPDLAVAAEPADALTVPVGQLRAVRLRRAGLPFTATEAARADALVRAASPPGDLEPTSRTVQLRDGTEIVVRPMEGRDGEAVRAMHQRCSLESRRLRYFSGKSALPQRVLDVFTERSRGLTLVAEGPDGSILAMAHLMHMLDPGVAELAFLVEDAWQSRGLGRALTQLLVVLGRERGLVELRATVLSENARMRRLLTASGGRVRRTEDPGVVEVKLRLDGRSASVPGGTRSLVR